MVNIKNMVKEITNIKELEEIMGKMYHVEAVLENSAQWEGFMETGKEYREALFTISRESREHKEIIEEISSNVDGIHVERVLKEAGREKEDFSELDDDEIISVILKHEEIARDMYKRLNDLTNRALIKEQWVGEDAEDYFRKLEKLVKDEKRHIALLTPFIGGMKGIEFQLP